MGSFYSCVKLINLETCDIIEVDLYKLVEAGIPEGYKPVGKITTDEWIELYCEAKRGQRK